MRIKIVDIVYWIKLNLRKMFYERNFKILKLGLIGVVSVVAISALTVSCSRKEIVNNNNNNQDVQKPGTGSGDNSGGNNGSQNPDQSGNNIKPEDLLVEQKLQQAFDGLILLKKKV